MMRWSGLIAIKTLNNLLLIRIVHPLSRSLYLNVISLNRKWWEELRNHLVILSLSKSILNSRLKLAERVWKVVPRIVRNWSMISGIVTAIRSRSSFTFRRGFRIRLLVRRRRSWSGSWRRGNIMIRSRDSSGRLVSRVVRERGRKRKRKN